MFSLEELGHILLPRPGVISSFVLRDSAGEVTDFCSFYHLPSTVMRCEKHNRLSAVYCYYNVSTTITYKELLQDALVLAHKEGCDVFNALTLADNASVLEALKFGAGDGFLHYYLYNWRAPPVEPADIGLVLL